MHGDNSADQARASRADFGTKEPKAAVNTGHKFVDYAMELLDGGDLQKQAPVPWQRACALAHPEQPEAPPAAEPLLADADAVVAHDDERTAVLVPGTTNLDFRRVTRAGVFHGVADQVCEDLADHRGVTHHHGQRRLQHHRDGQLSRPQRPLRNRRG